VLESNIERNLRRCLEMICVEGSGEFGIGETGYIPKLGGSNDSKSIYSNKRYQRKSSALILPSTKKIAPS
jgi:hypothetical protein